jgi:polyhydroxybutyrate depolymerase
MKKIFTILMFTAFIIQSNAQQNYINQSLQFDGLTRQYSIYVPTNYDGSAQYPLLFNFHGGNDVIASWQTLADMRSLAEAENFILVYPQARPDPSDGNSLNWLPKTAGTFDDVPFISTLIDAIAIDYQINQNRIYACGYSLGGEFAYELACKLNNRIAAIAAVARTMQANPNSYCAPTHPTGVLTILGTNDYTSPYNGLTYSGVEYYISAAATHNYWATHNNCETSPSMSPVSSSVERYTWSTEAGCAFVEELKVIGGGHDWPGVSGNMTIDANTEIWQFVSNYDTDGLIGCSTAAVNDLNNLQDAYKIYPNPVSDELKIQIKHLENQKVFLSIFDISGRLISETKSMVRNQQISLSTQAFNSGVFFAQIKLENGHQSKIKFIKL